MRSGILAGGNWIVDHLKRIDTYPRQDTLANILDESVGNGGSPFNILLDLAKLGAAFPLAGVGLVGKDADGEWIRQRCVEHGVDVTRLLSSEGSTSYTDVMTVQSTGRRTFFHHRGANAFLDAQHFDFNTCSARIFHLGYLLLLDRLDRADAEFGSVAARVLSRAQSEGIKTSIDLVSEDSERFSSVVLPALAYTNYCILNEFELGRTTATEVRKNDRIDLAAIKAAAGQLFEAGVGDAVFVHFPEGACAFRADGASWIQASVKVPQAEIVSTVGAGDAFAAGVLMGLHEEVSLDRCLRFGVAAAAACLRGAGASDGIPSMQECLAEAERKGFGCLE